MLGRRRLKGRSDRRKGNKKVMCVLDLHVGKNQKKANDFNDRGFATKQ
jgi:hypothetical protein